MIANNICININISACRRLLGVLGDLYAQEQKVLASVGSATDDLAPSWSGEDAVKFKKIMESYAERLTALRREGEAVCNKVERCLNTADEIESIWG